MVSRRERSAAAVGRLSGRELAHWRLEESSREAVLGWVGDPQTRYERVRPLLRRVIDVLRPVAEGIVAPLGRWLGEPGAVSSLVARCLGVAGVWPDGSEWPDPFAVWELDGRERDLLPGLASRLLVLLRVAAEVLAAEGVPLQPDAAANQVVLGQLLLDRVALEGSAREVVERLDILGPGGFDRDGLSKGEGSARVFVYLTGSSGGVVTIAA
jgi:hypothetical protein